MKIKKDKVTKLIQEIDFLIDKAKAFEKDYEVQLDAVKSGHRKSAKNLVHYLAIRTEDLTRLQNELGKLGLSRFARAEGHVMTSLLHSRFILNKLLDESGDNTGKSGLSMKRSDKLLNKNTKTLLGYRSKGRRVRIMVTLPTEVATNLSMVKKFVVAGMNCARINCAAEGPANWKQMIDNVKKAGKTEKRNIKVIMDLAGPKIRTGKILPGPRLLKFRPNRDEGGYVIHPAEIILATEECIDFREFSLPVSQEWLEKLKEGEVVRLVDHRGRKRKLIVHSIDKKKGLACLHCRRTSYISTGTELMVDRQAKTDPEIVGDLPALPGSIVLKPDDIITIHDTDEPGESAKYDDEGKVISNAHVSCTYLPVFKYVKKGEPVHFDDGKIRGIVEDVRPGAFDVRIVMAKNQGSTLKEDKGINLPETAIVTEGMTIKDQEDLQFVAAYADVVSYSFVNTPEDVEELLIKMQELDILEKVGIIIKIETQQAYNNLVPIMLTAMKAKNVGIMIARGDLAIEVGWDHMGRIQKEILSICGSAHLPVVWATQVLENLTKKGLPSRSEITDAVSALKSECIMLNKGPYIANSIRFLHNVLTNMEPYQHKQDRMLPILMPLDGVISN